MLHFKVLYIRKITRPLTKTLLRRKYFTLVCSSSSTAYASTVLGVLFRNANIRKWIMSFVLWKVLPIRSVC